jgi:hypothetical protein
MPGSLSCCEPQRSIVITRPYTHSSLHRKALTHADKVARPHRDVAQVSAAQLGRTRESPPERAGRDEHVEVRRDEPEQFLVCVEQLWRRLRAASAARGCAPVLNRQAIWTSRLPLAARLGRRVHLPWTRKAARRERHHARLQLPRELRARRAAVADVQHAHAPALLRRAPQRAQQGVQAREPAHGDGPQAHGGGEVADSVRDEREGAACGAAVGAGPCEDVLPDLGGERR